MKGNTRLINIASSVVAPLGLGLLMLTACAKQESASKDQAATPPVPAASAPPQQASNEAGPTEKPSAVVGGGQYSPFVGQNFPNRVYWGVAHVHTGYSFDSGMFGVTLTPDDLFKVATGGEVVMDNGVSASNRTGRWTGSPSPTMPSTWASPIKFAPAAPNSSPTHRASAGTRCPRQALRRVSKPPSKRSSPCRPASRSSTPASSRPRPGRTPPRQPRSGTSRASSPRCTASSGLPRPAATTFIAPSFSATARTA